MRQGTRGLSQGRNKGTEAKTVVSYYIVGDVKADMKERKRGGKSKIGGKFGGIAINSNTIYKTI